MPLFQLFLYSYALSFDVKHLPTAVLDLDRTDAVRQYVDALAAVQLLHGRPPGLDTYAQVDKALRVQHRQGRRRHRHRLRRRRSRRDARAAVQVLVDGSDANSAQLGQTYSGALSRVYGAQGRGRAGRGEGLSAAGAPARSAASTRIWYNPEGKSAAYFVPGLIVVLVTMVTVLQTANTLVKEKEQGTYEQLIVSPIRASSSWSARSRRGR